MRIIPGYLNLIYSAVQSEHWHLGHAHSVSAGL